MKKIYGANTESEAEQALVEFGEAWDKQYPTISKSWLNHWDKIIPDSNGFYVERNQDMVRKRNRICHNGLEDTTQQASLWKQSLEPAHVVEIVAYQRVLQQKGRNKYAYQWIVRHTIRFGMMRVQ